MKKCAPPSQPERWENINFLFAERQTSKLQKRIVKAYLERAYRKLMYLQFELIQSTSAKALAVKDITSHEGKNTPGIDRIIWNTPEEKMDAVFSLGGKRYTPLPLLRKYIPKSDGGCRPLGIPTMRDRAMQSLYKMALEPIAESTADSHSFGFRPGRSTKDAILLCKNIFERRRESLWVLDGDIKSCFDSISHEWLLENIPMDKSMIRKFLECGHYEDNIFHPCCQGVPQGGALSPVLCNMTLDGLQGRLEHEYTSEVEFVRYADDFVVIGTDPEILKDAVYLIDDFLSARGLELSKEKTAIVHLQGGFDFLGWNVRKVDDTICIIPSGRNRSRLITKVQNTMEQQMSRANTLKRLKQIICGWRDYHVKVVDPYDILDIVTEVKQLVLRYTDEHFAKSAEYLFWSR